MIGIDLIVEIGEYYVLKCIFKVNLDALLMVFPSECCWSFEGVWNEGHPTCTFRHVYPDGDVHWFHGSHNLSDGSVKQHTTKQVDNGWLTIHSYLEHNLSGVPYNCSLKSTASGRYIASSLVENPDLHAQRVRAQVHTTRARNGVGSQRPMWKCFFVLISLALTLN